MAAPVVLVISDLHMGAGALNDFEPEIANHFARFLTEWASYGAPVELVINGDLLDFVQAPPFQGADLESATPSKVRLCFTEAQSLAKLDAIHREHEGSFDAMAGFLRGRPDKSITVLPGNHDPDFFWPRVRDRFVSCLSGAAAGARDRLRFHFDRAYRPRRRPDLWIEHGHQFDPINAFDIDGTSCWSALQRPIFSDRKGVQRLYECIGTRLLIRYLNGLDATYPFVDNVKPFKRFLQIFGASAFVPGYGPLRAAFAVAGALRFLTRTGVGNFPELMEADDEPLPDPTVRLERALALATPEQQEAFYAALEADGYELDVPLRTLRDNASAKTKFIEFVAQHPEALAPLEDCEPGEVLELRRGYKADETGDLKRAAHEILADSANGCDCVTMGHTHQTVRERRYFNTGSWTRYLECEPGDELRPWSMLRSASYREFPYELNFLLADAAPGGDVRMTTFEPNARQGPE